MGGLLVVTACVVIVSSDAPSYAPASEMDVCAWGCGVGGCGHGSAGGHQVSNKIVNCQKWKDKGYKGCYKDNSSRNLKHGPKKYGYTVDQCISTCRGSNYKYAALQNGKEQSDKAWCSCDNAYGDDPLVRGDDQVYTRTGDDSCQTFCKGTASDTSQGFCMKGGAWRNAIY